MLSMVNMTVSVANVSSGGAKTSLPLERLGPQKATPAEGQCGR